MDEIKEFLFLNLWNEFLVSETQIVSTICQESSYINKDLLNFRFTETIFAQQFLNFLTLLAAEYLLEHVQ